ncbi:ribonuclease E inhibitor RraB [Chitinophaga horti]|uniref:Ribonuclease E inhibitor RraB n=1 Tax=Chitinophaga horti TaxID=2920382 RepID=A0ABY6J844_9BACT|nr:ribonuclease E inhibitor RraB [Chitinophaga horti]UYQ94451.1 ribonuclease E inhibitor RraB [Chitinophaga horti]
MSKPNRLFLLFCTVFLAVGIFYFIEQRRKSDQASPKAEVERMAITDSDQTDKLLVAELRKLGVTPEDSLKLEYFFYTSSASSAAQLTDSLKQLGYTASYRRAADNSSEIVVTGWTSPMLMQDSIVMSWSARMRDMAVRYNSLFDGWGTDPHQKK